MKKSLTNQEKRFAKVHKGAFAHFCKEIIPLFAIIFLPLHAIIKTEDMRRQLFGLLVVLLLTASVAVSAQTSLAGRTYHHPNVLAGMINEATKDVDKRVAEARAKAIARVEKKKGRKLTDEEKRKLVTRLRKVTGKAISPIYKIDPSIVGGITITCDGKFFDGSVVRNLKNIKEAIS